PPRLPAGSCGGVDPLAGSRQILLWLLESEAEAPRATAVQSGRGTGTFGSRSFSFSMVGPDVQDLAEMINAHPEGWVKEMGLHLSKATAEEVRCEWEVGPRH